MPMEFHLAKRNFNSHTREGVTIGYNQYDVWAVDFNSHTREGVTCR